jgi:signal transduction histidine kinase
MVTDSGNSINQDEFEKSPEDFFDRSRKEIEKYSILGLAALIAAVLLLTFDLKLFSGIFIIAAAATGLLINRKVSVLNLKIRESLNAFSDQNEKKDDVIIDFSHKIREPLNNLVIVVDMLIESGLQKKQQDLFDTFIASTNNMVTILNELTMKSAGNLSYQLRKAIKFNLLSTIQNTIELYNLKDKASIDFILNK